MLCTALDASHAVIVPTRVKRGAIMSLAGMSVSEDDLTNANDEVGSLTAEEISETLSVHQTFRLTEEERSRLRTLARDAGMSVSMVLRGLVQQAVTDVE
jgi:hypothetical protein